MIISYLIKFKEYRGIQLLDFSTVFKNYDDSPPNCSCIPMLLSALNNAMLPNIINFCFLNIAGIFLFYMNFQKLKSVVIKIFYFFVIFKLLITLIIFLQRKLSLTSQHCTVC